MAAWNNHIKGVIMQKLGIALYGINGHQIVGHLPKLNNVRLIAVSGVSREQFVEISKLNPEIFKGIPYAEHLDELLNNPDIQLISFCSPRRDQQASQAIRAMRAHKHVLVEKPAATTRQDLEALRKTSQETGMQVRVMTTMIYQSEPLKMKEIVESGVLGEIVQIYAMKSYPYLDGRPQDNGVDGGLTMQALIHAVSLIRFITGHEFSEVFAQETGYGNPKRGDLKMATNVACRLDNGALASLIANYLNPRGIGFHGNDQLRLHGTKGVLECVDGFTRMRIAFENKPFEDIEVPATAGLSSDPECPMDRGPVVRSATADQPWLEKRWIAEYPQDYIDHLLGGPPTLMTQEDGFRNTEVVLAAQESADTGKAVRLLRLFSL